MSVRRRACTLHKRRLRYWNARVTWLKVWKCLSIYEDSETDVLLNWTPACHKYHFIRLGGFFFIYFFQSNLICLIQFQSIWDHCDGDCTSRDVPDNRRMRLLWFSVCFHSFHSISLKPLILSALCCNIVIWPQGCAVCLFICVRSYQLGEGGNLVW